MKKHAPAPLSEICRLDDWQAFDAYLQNEITAGDSHSILQDDSLQAILSAKNIFAAFLARYDGGFCSKAAQKRHIVPFIIDEALKPF